MNLNLFLWGVTLVLLSVASAGVSLENQTVQLNSTTQCVTLVSADSNNATVCGFWNFTPSVVNLSFGGNLATPVLNATVFNTTVFAPAYPAINQHINLTGGQAYLADDARTGLRVSCISQNQTFIVTNETIVQKCEPLNVLQTLNPNEEYFNPSLNIRVKAPTLVEVEKDLKEGEVFERNNTCYGRIFLTAPTFIANATLNASQSATPTPPPLCGSGTHYENGACLADSVSQANAAAQALNNQPMVGGFPLLDLIVVLAVLFVVWTKYGQNNQPKKQEGE